MKIGYIVTSSWMKNSIKLQFIPLLTNRMGKRQKEYFFLRMSDGESRLQKAHFTYQMSMHSDTIDGLDTTRKRQTDKQKDRQTNRESDRYNQTDRQGERDRERERQRESDRERGRQNNHFELPGFTTA